MDRLPPETLHDIVAHCDLPSCRQLRFVCKDLSDMATEHIFETIFLALVPASIEKVRKIASHPKLSLSVRTLIFCPQLLPRYQNLSDWKVHLNSRTFPKLPLCHGVVFADPATFVHELEESELSDWTAWDFEDDDGTKISLEKWVEFPDRVLSPREQSVAFRKHVTWFRAQREWLRNGFTDEMLYLLHRLPNLENAEVPDHRGLRSLAHWRWLRSELLQTPGEWMLTPGASIDGWGVEQLASLLEATALAGRPLKKLVFDLDPNALLSHKTISQVSTPPCGLTDDRVVRMAGAFDQLRELNADFCRDREEANDTAAQRLATLLQGAKQLKKLDLSLTQCVCRPGIKGGVDVLSYLKELHLPKLTTLVMSSIRTSEASLLGILSAHAKTLKFLSLNSINLNPGEGSWVSVIRELPFLLSLDHAVLGSLGEATMPHGQGYHVKNFYHLFDCEGPGWDEYYSAVELWVLEGDKMDDEDFPILNAAEWDELFPENPALATEPFGGLDSDDDNDTS